MYTVISGILDGDHKGTGQSTMFWLEVRDMSKVIKRFEYSLMDELTGKFNKRAEIKPYMDQVAELKRMEEQKKEQEKQDALTKRLNEVSISPELDTIVSNVLETSPAIVEQFRMGKDKALNSLVGLVIVKLKQKNITSDAFSIKAALQQKLK